MKYALPILALLLIAATSTAPKAPTSQPTSQPKTITGAEIIRTIPKEWIAILKSSPKDDSFGEREKHDAALADVRAKISAKYVGLKLETPKSAIITEISRINSHFAVVLKTPYPFDVAVNRVFFSASYEPHIIKLSVGQTLPVTVGEITRLGIGIVPASKDKPERIFGSSDLVVK